MGRGRKTESYTLPEKPKSSWSVNCSVSTRNLGRAELAGVIFGCTNNTKQECISKLLFGLPAPHISYVKHVRPGLPLFLFNYSDRKLHGIYEAASEGKMNIDPFAWSENGSECTRFPAQVRVRIQMQCKPLIEDQFGSVIIDNYFESNHFWFELDHGQTTKLMSMFKPVPVLRNINKSTVHSKAHIGQSSKRTNNEEAHIVVKSEETCPQSYGSASKEQSFSLPHKKWNKLFAKSTDTSSTSALSTSSLEEVEGLKQHIGQSSKQTNNEEAHKVVKSEEIRLQSYGSASNEQSFFLPQEKCNELFAKSTNTDSTSALSTSSLEEFDGLKQDIETLYSSRAIDNDLNFLQKGSMEIISSKADTSEGNISLLNRANIINCSLPREESVSDVNPESTMHKILEELDQLKLNEAIQDRKIRSLEQELVESRRVIKNLNLLLEISERSKCQQIDIKESKSSSIDKSILIVGGFDGLSHSSSIDCYCPSRDSLESLCPMTSMRSYTSAVKLNAEVYVIGGECYNSWYNTVESYNLESKHWITHPPLNRKKGSLAGICLNDMIFAIGGSNGAQCFSEVEVFDINVGIWIPSKSMQDRRYSLAAAEINGAIYAVGGYDGKDYLKSLERYDPREWSWKSLESMSTKRSCHSLAVLNEKLYAIGGYNGEQMVSTVEMYDPRMNHWMMVESMNDSRGYAAAVVIGRSIFAIGGFIDDKVSDKVEYYTETQGWHSTNLKALGKRCAFSAVVL